MGKFWSDEDLGPVQWPTREPVRPALYDDGQGWLLPRLVAARQRKRRRAGRLVVLVVLELLAVWWWRVASWS